MFERRFSYLYRVLRNIERHQKDVFPEEWALSTQIVVAFTAKTVNQLHRVFEQYPGGLPVSEVPAMMKAMHKSLDFEAQMLHKYQHEAELSAEFVPWLNSYVQVVSDKIDADMRGKLVEDMEVSGVALGIDQFPSCAHLFLLIKESYLSMKPFSTGEAFFDLVKEYQVHLKAYCKTLRTRLDASDMVTTCKCINSAEYASRDLGSLE